MRLSTQMSSTRGFAMPPPAMSLLNTHRIHALFMMYGLLFCTTFL